MAEGLDEPEFVTINGYKVLLEQITGFSDYFRSLLKGHFSEAKEREFQIQVDGVPENSEAWFYFVNRAQNNIVDSCATHVRWLERLRVVTYLCCTEIQKPPTWFIEDLTKNCYSPNHYEYLLSIWQTLFFVPCISFSEILPLTATVDLAEEIWKKGPPDMLRAWSHKYAAGAHGELALKVVQNPDFWKNVAIYSEGLLPLDDWPSEVVWSGGSVADCWLGNIDKIYPGRDFDLWIWTDINSSNVLARIIKDLKKKRPDLLIWNKGSTIDILFPGSPFHIQILIRNKSGPWQIPFRFDFDYVRAYVGSDQKIRAFPECIQAWESRTVTWYNPTAVISADRLSKAAKKGFHIADIQIPVHQTESGNLPWFHPQKQDPFDHVERICSALIPTSQLCQDLKDVVLVPEKIMLTRYENVPEIKMEIEDKALLALLETNDLEDFQVPAIHFRLIVEIYWKSVNNCSDRLLELRLMAQCYESHRQFRDTIRRLEAKAKARDPRFQAEIPDREPSPVEMFPIDDNYRFGKMYDEDGKLIPVDQWTKFRGMAEVSFSLAGITKIYNARRLDRVDSSKFYFRFSRIQLLDREAALRPLTGISQQLRVTYLGK